MMVDLSWCIHNFHSKTSGEKLTTAKLIHGEVSAIVKKVIEDQIFTHQYVNIKNVIGNIENNLLKTRLYTKDLELLSETFREIKMFYIEGNEKNGTHDQIIVNGDLFSIINDQVQVKENPIYSHVW